MIIGVKDDRTVVGVDILDEVYRKLSNVITTQIEPTLQDEVSSELKFNDRKTLIVINVTKGIQPIYCQKKYGQMVEQLE